MLKVDTIQESNETAIKSVSKAQSDPDLIASLCFDAYKTLGKSGKPDPNKNEFTVLAAIVEYFGVFENVRVVCLATGTKCFPKNVKDYRNEIVDCHAESLLKRAFKRYLIKIIENKPEDAQLNQIKLNSNDKKYCIFVSQIPCGTISRWKGNHIVNHHHDKDLEIYKDIGVNRKPGRGELCPKAGCIHKIAKWNLFGLQGCRLLPLIKEPILFDHLIIGNCESIDNIESELQIIHNRLIWKTEKYIQIDSIIEKSIQHARKIGLHFATNFKKKEFIRNKIPCGSSIVAWLDGDNQFKTEILASGRKLGSRKRKLFEIHSKSDFGLSLVCDSNLNQDIDRLYHRFSLNP
ncbi:hypothetical protein NH340_JMT05305 [Sarcoptes scabiei]|nr:hypothetical protein NH340_JMT05305 [Sarcoptes scabiei]